jgi:hypothetical protein
VNKVNFKNVGVPLYLYLLYVPFCKGIHIFISANPAPLQNKRKDSDSDPLQHDKLNPDPHQSNKLDPDPQNFADDKLNCMEY